MTGEAELGLPGTMDPPLPIQSCSNTKLRSCQVRAQTEHERTSTSCRSLKSPHCLTQHCFIPWKFSAFWSHPHHGQVWPSLVPGMAETAFLGTWCRSLPEVDFSAAHLPQFPTHQDNWSCTGVHPIQERPQGLGKALVPWHVLPQLRWVTLGYLKEEHYSQNYQQCSGAEE